MNCPLCNVELDPDRPTYPRIWTHPHSNRCGLDSVTGNRRAWSAIVERERNAQNYRRDSRRLDQAAAEDLRSLRQERDKWRDRAEIAEAGVKHGLELYQAVSRAVLARDKAAKRWKQAATVYRARFLNERAALDEWQRVLNRYANDLCAANQERARLRGLIREHNAACNVGCCGGSNQSAPCDECPREWLIETEECDAD